MENTIVRVFLHYGARLPQKASAGAAGYDVHACLEPDTYIEISAGDFLTIPTGLIFEIPDGFFISLRPRSGLALKHGLTLLNTPATIDSDYRGELKVLLINLGQKPVIINHGDRIAQLLLEKSRDIEWLTLKEQPDIDETARGTGGFGSTGLGLA